MRTIQGRWTVGEDGKLVIDLPPDVEPGEHSIVLVIEETDGYRRQENLDPSLHNEGIPRQREALDIPVLHIDHWPEDFSLRREDMYGDDGR